MSMALKQDVIEAQLEYANAKPIDLVHLSAQTMGDKLLEAEVLGIFSNQAKILVNLISSGTTPVAISQAAHSLKGACMGIGAFKLAKIAQQAETSGKYDTALDTELANVIEYIITLHS